jgi:hypothetical protein
MKDIYTIFNEALDELSKSPEKEKKFRLIVPLGAKVPVEVQVNCAEAVLKGKIEEAQRIVTTKHNGRLENFDESNPMHRADGAPTFTTNNAGTEARAKSDANLYEALGLTVEEKNKLTGKHTNAYDNLTERQKSEYNFARAIGISESDSLKLAHLCLKEVNKFPCAGK